MALSMRWFGLAPSFLVVATVGCPPPYGRPRAPGVAGPTHPLVDAARALREQPYQLGGRDHDRLPGVDCEGLVFLAYAAVYGVPWRHHAVDPTRFVADQSLGTPVPGLSGCASDSIDYERLQPGDILLILRFDKNPKEPALCRLEGREAWVWHMGLYTGGPERAFIHADPYHGAVVEVPLPRYLGNFWLDNEGVFVVRPPRLPPVEASPR